MRRAALLERVPYYTTAAGAIAAVQAIAAMRDGALEVKPLQSYFA
jgi:carbamoyl-phosphate synthase large subunit